MQLFLASVSLAIACALSNFNSAFAWEVGEEREVEPSSYTTLYARHGSFDVWRNETKNRVACVAIAHEQRPEPKGTNMFFTFGPSVNLKYFFDKAKGFTSPKVEATVQVALGSCEYNVEWRVPGSRFGFSARDEEFWDEKSTSRFSAISDRHKIFKHLASMDGSSVEISGSYYTYCNIRKGGGSYQDKLDLTGINAAANDLIRCEEEALK